MSTIRKELVYQTIQKAHASIDYNTHKGLHNLYEFIKQTILTDNSLTEDEKTEAIRLTNRDYDRDKIRCNLGTRRICENCNQKCLATSYCEFCVQNYLKTNFSNWTSGNSDIDDLIQKCQLGTYVPNMIVEWIPYKNLKNIKYLTRGGFAEIYTADWIGGRYEKWDSKKQQLIRLEDYSVVLKELENVESASQSWFEEVKIHLDISNKYPRIVRCYGLTQNPSNGNYILVMSRLDLSLREYLQQNHNHLTWKEKINIAFEIIDALRWIHNEKSIHRDLHSGNILFYQYTGSWHISDLGFCGPVDSKLSNGLYGNLPYIAPEVIAGTKATFESDIYSIAMLMWEISSGLPPFYNYAHDCDLALKIINGMRPKIVSGTPLEYKNLMKQCWDADPSNRLSVNTLLNKISEINALYKNMPNELNANNNFETRNSKTNCTNNASFASKVHQFKNLPDPRNATEEEQEAFHSKPYEFSIPDNINDLNNPSNQNDDNTSKSSDISKDIKVEESVSEQSVCQAKQNNFAITENKNEVKGKSKRIYSEDEEDDLIDNYRPKKLKLRSNNDEVDEDEISNNPNLHSEDQDELVIPEYGF
ncbi:kinase-like domain-containing protein [Rhizophagus clarus]|uniref:Kinase-like domain-containing protein n=1 Tax=Rhizophagus clarus TaxID=94130 RepID=A0A8H3QVB5_9GLOM|nr:kinase-like domain-containing protein [Rhizophagus clarus]